jgi:hypothetical protein
VDYVILILRTVPLTQLANLRGEGGYKPGTNEQEMDLLTMGLQQLQDLADRSITIPLSEDPADYTLTLPAEADRANKQLGFDDNGNIAVGDEIVSGLGDDVLLHVTAPIKINGSTSALLVNEPTITLNPADIKLDDLGTPDDNTDLDASTSVHGLLPKRPSSLATGKIFRGDGTYVEDILTISVGFDGAGSTLVGPLVIDKRIPFNCTILDNQLLANAAGNCTVAIAKDAYASFPPTTSIVASAPPTLSGAAKSQDSTLTGWTKTVTADDIMRFTFDSITVMTRVQLSLKIRRTT